MVFDRPAHVLVGDRHVPRALEAGQEAVDARHRVRREARRVTPPDGVDRGLGDHRPTVVLEVVARRRCGTGMAGGHDRCVAARSDHGPDDEGLPGIPAGGAEAARRSGRRQDDADGRAHRKALPGRCSPRRAISTDAGSAVKRPRRWPRHLDLGREHVVLLDARGSASSSAAFAISAAAMGPERCACRPSSAAKVSKMAKVRRSNRTANHWSVPASRWASGEPRAEEVLHRALLALLRDQTDEQPQPWISLRSHATRSLSRSAARAVRTPR